MVVKKLQKKLSMFKNCRKGTAEVVGTVLFLVIVFFVFTNIYLWHDTATREMNTIHFEKMNSPLSVRLIPDESNPTGLEVTNNGGVEAGLSRVWIISDTNHYPIDLNLRIARGAKIVLQFSTLGISTPTQKTTYNILTTLGNMAACTYYP
ncbi:MAG: hypothetical protein NUK63_05430 [Candidatus Bathyarchaeum tardum]|nr:MAG: hypothetical protein NUK63_05430 [Candidatus Bathyarchaeum tardum]